MTLEEFVEENNDLIADNNELCWPTWEIDQQKFDDYALWEYEHNQDLLLIAQKLRAKQQKETIELKKQVVYVECFQDNTLWMRHAESKKDTHHGVIVNWYILLFSKDLK